MTWPSILRRSLASDASILWRVRLTSSAPLPGVSLTVCAAVRMTIHPWFAIFTIWPFLKTRRFGTMIFPSWWQPRYHPLLDTLDESIKQSVKKATHGFIINYEAEALGSPDPAW